MTLRRLTATDAAPLRALWAKGLRESPTSFLRTEEELSAIPDDAFGQGIDHFVYFGTWTGSDLTGFAVARPGEMTRLRHTADIGPLYVHPDFQRQGIARALMQTLLDHLRAGGLLQAELTVDAANTPAITLYQSMGFHTFGRRPRSVIVDGTARADLLMLCALDGTDLTRDMSPA